MSYSIPTEKEVTDEKGIFKYIDGEIVIFKIGGITIGSVKVQTKITPFTLLNTDNPLEFKVVQILLLIILENCFY
jgi:hypothetical protein